MCEIIFAMALKGRLYSDIIDEVGLMLHTGASKNAHGFGIFDESGRIEKSPVQYFETEHHGILKSFTNPRMLITHARYATQGAHTEENTHPLECGGWIIVHNGVLHGDDSIRTRFGIPDSPRVDSFVIAWLVDHFANETPGDYKTIFANVCSVLSGSYSVFAFEKATKKLFYFRDTSKFTFALIKVGKREYIFGSTIKQRLEDAFMDNQYGFEVDIAEKRSYATPKENTLYRVSIRGITKVCDLPSATIEEDITTVVRQYGLRDTSMYECGYPKHIGYDDDIPETQPKKSKKPKGERLSIEARRNRRKHLHPGLH